MRTSRVISVVAVGIAAVALFGMAWVATAGTFRGTACAFAFPTARCVAMTEYAAAKLGTAASEIAWVVVLPPKVQVGPSGERILTTLGGAAPVETLVGLRDGTKHHVSMDCFGIPARQCRDDP